MCLGPPPLDPTDSPSRTGHGPLSPLEQRSSKDAQPPSRGRGYAPGDLTFPLQLRCVTRGKIFFGASTPWIVGASDPPPPWGTVQGGGG